MDFEFNPLKMAQAAGVLLALDGGSMDLVRLLKLLYIADRELLAEVGRPLTGDRAVAMKNGPVLSRSYDLLKRSDARSAAGLDRYLGRDGYKVVLRADPGRGELTRRDEEKLREVADRFRCKSTWDLSEHTHTFDEWREAPRPRKATPIPWERALIALGRGDRIGGIEAGLAEQGAIDDAFRALANEGG